MRRVSSHRNSREGGLGRRVLSGALLCGVALLSACQSDNRQSETSAGSGKSAALQSMERVAIAAHRCWFASQDPAFRPYRMANELNSFTGRPRFLLVPAKDFEARPLLVVQAEGNSSAVEVFGPLMNEAIGRRISSDVARWATGNNSCGGAA